MLDLKSGRMYIAFIQVFPLSHHGAVPASPDSKNQPREGLLCPFLDVSGIKYRD